MLITTRSRVNRDDIYNIPLAAMTMEEARDFLLRLVERTRKPMTFDRLDRDDLIHRCEANPLVLQWVVRQIDLAKRPQDVLDDLTRGEGDAAERVFTRSFNLPQLGGDGRAALLALSLFTSDASRKVLAEVSGFDDDIRRLLGLIAKSKGELEEERRLYGESLIISRRLSDRNGIVMTLRSTGQLEKEEGHKEEAVTLFHEALRIYEKLGSPSAKKVRDYLTRLESSTD